MFCISCAIIDELNEVKNASFPCMSEVKDAALGLVSTEFSEGILLLFSSGANEKKPKEEVILYRFFGMNKDNLSRTINHRSL